jgi:hypothetical protein
MRTELEKLSIEGATTDITLEIVSTELEKLSIVGEITETTPGAGQS